MSGQESNSSFFSIATSGSAIAPGLSGTELEENSLNEIEKYVIGFMQIRTSISKYLDPENGLILCLQCRGVLTLDEYSQLEKSKLDERKSYMDLNDELLCIIHPRFKSCCLQFMTALQESSQHHIVNFIMDGGISQNTDVRVLSADEIHIIDNNMFCLVNLINPYRMNFLYRLVSKKCITNRHKEKVERWLEPEKKIDELLRIMKRRSHRDFENFKFCLRDTMQNNIVDILEKGGIVTVRVKLQGRKGQEDYRIQIDRTRDRVLG